MNFDEINIENCYRSGYQALQNKEMAEEIKFLREQISEKKIIIRSLFPLKLANREEDNLFHKVVMANIYLKVVLMMKSPNVNV